MSEEETRFCKNRWIMGCVNESWGKLGEGKSDEEGRDMGRDRMCTKSNECFKMAETGRNIGIERHRYKNNYMYPLSDEFRKEIRL